MLMKCSVKHLRFGYITRQYDSGGKGHDLFRAFIPERHHPNFVSFSLYSCLAAVCSSIGGVLSTQSLLIAASHIAPDVPSEISVAATLHWIVKDGLGQFGGILFATKFGTKLDTNPQSLRFYSMISLQVGVFLELFTAILSPHAFLPLAALANVAKNVSWMGMSATRVKAMEEFQVDKNIADLSSKHSSQTIAANLLGMIGGIGISGIGAVLSIEPTKYNICTFPLFSMAAVYFTWKSCKFMLMMNDKKHLNIYRVKALIKSLMANNLLADLTKVDAWSFGKSMAMVAGTEGPDDWNNDPIPNVLINPTINKSLANRMSKLEADGPPSFFFCCVDGKFCLWFHSFEKDIIPIILIACYCSEMVDKSEHHDLSTSMVDVFKQTKEHHIKAFAALADELFDHWTLLD